MARLLADNITETINNGDIVERSENSIDRPKVNVFPYSIFYVFYEQYLTMFEDTLRSLGISIGAVFIVTFILSGFDLMTSIVTILVIIMILVDLGRQ
jgi:Niemann-Pick C1 protein